MATDSGRYVLASVGLVVLVIFVYFVSLWGVPRYDQLAYLYQAAQFRDFSDLLAHSASWNRRFLDGDRLLYRPLLYALLAAQYCLVGLWLPLLQALGLTPHLR